MELERFDNNTKRSTLFEYLELKRIRLNRYTTTEDRIRIIKIGCNLIELTKNILEMVLLQFKKLIMLSREELKNYKPVYLYLGVNNM